ncbi:MAG: pirin family protein [Myxococcales bacterium]|nr:pirin family protein [Myxococcales bacterium]
MEPRRIVRVLPSTRTLEGGGFVVRRPFPVRGIDHVDPFLLLDELGPVDYAAGRAVGAPDHPHRGFETVTYVLDGEVEHEDSAGHRGFIGKGDVQWMTAGAGIVHSEMPSRRLMERGGRMHGFQLWVNLPSKDKMMAPRYQEVPGANIPKATSHDGLASVAVIAGTALGVSAVIDTRTKVAYHDWTLQPGARVELDLDDAMRGFAFVFAGRASVAGTEVDDGSCALFEEGGALALSCDAEAKEPARLLLIAGEPLREPVARYGPFVMNTTAELEQAFNDYRSGKMGAIEREH